LATELGLALAEKGHQVHFITYRQPARLNIFQENVFYHEVCVADYPLFEYPPYDTALASKMVDVARFEKLDLLHVHYALPHAAVAYMAKKILESHNITLPVVTTLHGTDITVVGHIPTFAPVVEFSIDNSDGVTAVSQSLKEDTYKLFNVQKEIKVIYNFVDFKRFRKCDKDHFKKAVAPHGERILVHTSNFRKVKRVEDVIRIFHLLHQKMPAKLLLIGDGPERHNMEELCRQLSLCDDIRFLGKQEAVEELLCIADLFLLPSEHESFGLAVHGKTGFLAPVGDVEAMAGYALQILESDETLARFRKNALEQAHTFDINYILPQYEAYYKEVVAMASTETVSNT